MLIYKDIQSGCEMLTDTYPIKMNEPIKGMMTVKCCMRKPDCAGEYDIGANASQEEEQEQLQEVEGEMGVNIVYDLCMTEITLEKKDFKKYMKDVMKKMLQLKMEHSPDTVKEFKEDSQNMMQWVLSNYDSIQLFVGGQLDVECMPAILINDNEGPRMYYFCHAMETEKA